MSTRELDPAELERAVSWAPLHDDWSPEGEAREVARRYGLPVSQLLGPSSTPHARSGTAPAARRELYAVLRSRGWSYPQIGRFCGGRDHTTVIQAIRKK
jgi:chromosomal replication initiation ATPase DnaA